MKNASFGLLMFLALFTGLWGQTGVYTVDGGSATVTDQTYAATQTDQSAVYVLNSGILTLNSCTMTKTGDSSDVNESSEYGLNAGVLVTSSGTVAIMGGSIDTQASGANGLFATGSGSVATMTGGTISAVGSSAHGVDVTYGGVITLVNVDVYTNGDNSSALATDFGGGTVTATGGTVTSACTDEGSHSAGIYSTGTITVNDATVSSYADFGGVIDGANHIILNNTSLTGNVGGIKLWKTAPDAGAATVIITGGSLSTDSGSALYITGEAGNGASGEITVCDGTTVTSADDYLIEVIEDSEAELTISNTDLTGDAYADDSSSLTIVMENGATLTGIISNAALELDADCMWSLTGTSTLTTIANVAGISGTAVTNITGNGYIAYYDPDLSGNAYLGGTAYTLVNGGYLAPEGWVNTADDEEVATLCTLEQNYPNPFNPVTTLAFSLGTPQYVTLAVYSVRGELVKTIVEGSFAAGNHTVQWNGTDVTGAPVASGVYLVRLKGNTVQTRKITLLK